MSEKAKKKKIDEAISLPKREQSMMGMAKEEEGIEKQSLKTMQSYLKKARGRRGKKKRGMRGFI